MVKKLFTSLFILLFSGAVIAAGKVPSASKVAGKWVLTLPASLSARIRQDYPEYVVPDPNNTNSVWEASIYNDKRLPFIVWGDLSGDKMDDVAIVLVDKSEKKGLLAIYHQTRDEYKNAWELKALENVITTVTLTYLPKGHTYPFKGMNEDGDVVEHKIEFPAGGVKLLMIDMPVWFIDKHKGKYRRRVIGSN